MKAIYGFMLTPGTFEKVCLMDLIRPNVGEKKNVVKKMPK